MVATHTGAREVLMLGPTDVRYGSLADICSATRHVRYGPQADIVSGIRLNKKPSSFSPEGFPATTTKRRVSLLSVSCATRADLMRLVRW